MKDSNDVGGLDISSAEIANCAIASQRLSRNKERVMQTWESRTRSRIPAAQGVGETTLRNSLPKFLDELSKTLANPSPETYLQHEEKKLAREHGEERSELPQYDLGQMIEEYQILRKVLFQVLREEAPLSEHAQEIILDAIAIGIRNATAEFIRQRESRAAQQTSLLHRSEAKAEAAFKLAESSRRELYEFFMQAPAAMCILSGNQFLFTLANPIYESFVGRSVLGKTVLEAFSANEVGDFIPLLTRVYETGEPFIGRGVAFDIQNADGQVARRYIDLGYHPFREPDGKIKGILALVQDVTDQVLARNALTQSKTALEIERRNFGALFEQSSGFVAMFEGPQFVYGYSNDTNKRIIGFDPTGKAIADVVPDVQGSGLLAQLKRVYETGREEVIRELPIMIEDVTRYFNATYVAHRDGSGKVDGVMTWGVDVTDQVQSRKTLEATEIRYRDAKQTAEAANAAKSSFLANMSHEIRTPMTAVLGFTEVLKDPVLSSEERDDALKRIEGSGRALLRVIDDVLDISKIEAGKLTIQKTKFSPFESATEVVSLLRLAAEQKGIALRLKIDPSCPATCCSDPARVRQILTNLVGNAIKFTSVGEVTLKVKAESPTTLAFDVCDSGIGISETDREKLFQPFAQADGSITRTFGGTGLGLTLSRRLSELLGGSLALSESEPGKGSRFTLRIDGFPFDFDLPLATTSTSKSNDVIAEGLLRNCKILLAEDVADNQVLMRRYLTSVGAHVEIANNGEEAIAKASGEFDLILMDIQMPKLDGIEATKRLRRAGFKKPIIALTAHAMRDEIKRSIDAGCTAHLTKPITKAELVHAILDHARPVQSGD